MGKEQTNLENQKEAAFETIKKLAFFLRRYKIASKLPGPAKKRRDAFIIFAETAAEDIIEIRNQFFPDKTLREILSKPNEPTRGSRTAF